MRGWAKTESSEGYVPVPDRLAAELQRWRHVTQSRLSPGRPISQRNCLSCLRLWRMTGKLSPARWRVRPGLAFPLFRPCRKWRNRLTALAQFSIGSGPMEINYKNEGLGCRVFHIKVIRAFR